MNKHINLLLAITLMFTLNNCSDKKEDKKFRTIQYFDKHKDIRDKRVLECKTLKDTTELDAKDCANANFSARSGKVVDTSNWY